MSGSLIPNAKQQFLDANGNPLAGGFVYFYIPSTTTFKNTYQNAALTILNTNPIILDSAGEAIIYGNGSYRQIVTDVNGNLIWDQTTVVPITISDVVTFYSASNGSSLIGYTQGSANAVSRTVQNKLQESVSVKDFGAVGDGTTDDSTAILNASATGKYVNFPQGNYLVNTNITPASMLWYSVSGAVITIPNAIQITADNISVDLDGISFYGNMTSAQYTPEVTGANIVTAFGTPTYLDSSGTPFAGADFTHTLVSNTLTISLAALTGNANRTVLSNFIALTSANSYVFNALANSIAQTGNFAGLTINTYNSSQVLIGTFVPNANNQLISLTGASYIKLGFKVQRTTKCSATNGTTIIDLSQIAFFRCINEASTALNTSYGQSILMENCLNAVINNCTFKYMNKVPVAPVNSNNIRFTNNTVIQCVTGLGTNGCYNAFFENNYIDLRQLSTDGNFYNLKYLRFKAISGINSPNLTITNNLLIGANWGIEYSPQTNCKSVITGNTIYAEIFGISLLNGVDSVVNNNNIQLSAGYCSCGIELPGSHVNVISNQNTINFESSYATEARAFSVSYVDPWIGSISNNASNAYCGVYASSGSSSNPNSTLTVLNNTFKFSTVGIFAQFLNSININNNIIKKNGSAYLSYVTNVTIDCFSDSLQNVMNNNLETGDEGALFLYINYLTVLNNLINMGNVVYPLAGTYNSNANILLKDNIYYGSTPTAYVSYSGTGVVYNAINNYTNAGVLVP